MGWELRKGRWYLYRNLRVNGNPKKEYLAAQGGIGSVMALELATRQDRLRESRDRARKAAARERTAIDGVLAAAGGANESIKIVAEGDPGCPWLSQSSSGGMENGTRSEQSQRNVCWS